MMYVLSSLLEHGFVSLDRSLMAIPELWRDRLRKHACCIGQYKLPDKTMEGVKTW